MEREEVGKITCGGLLPIVKSFYQPQNVKIFRLRRAVPRCKIIFEDQLPSEREERGEGGDQNACGVLTKEEALDILGFWRAQERSTRYSEILKIEGGGRGKREKPSGPPKAAKKNEQC